MPKLYTRRSHERELSALRETYDGRIGELQAALAELKEENRRLSAEVALLSSQKQAVSDAMIAAGEKKKQMEAELGEFVRSEKAIAVQSAEKARVLLEDVRAAYPDRAGNARFAAFERRLNALLGGETAKSDEMPARRETALAATGGNDGTGASEADFSAGAEENPAPEIAGQAEIAADADGEWDLKAVLETLGLSDD